MGVKKMNGEGGVCAGLYIAATSHTQGGKPNSVRQVGYQIPPLN